ncbi:cytochrome P450 [Mycobacterium sp. BMJ-28]
MTGPSTSTPEMATDPKSNEEQPMTKTVAEYPFPVVPPAEAVRAYHRVCEDRPMTKVTMPIGGDVWVVHRHRAARQVLESQVFVRGPFARGEQEIPYFVQFPDFLRATVQFADAPQHTRLRKLVAKAFTARRVNTLREGAEVIADELLDAMAQRGPEANLVDDFALPLPIRVIGELLGVPPADRDKFAAWSQSTLATSGMSTDEIANAGIQLYTYLATLVGERRAEPRDDLISALAGARELDDSLSDDEILTMAMLLIVGGFDNTANFINLGVVALLRHPDQLQTLLADIDGVVATTVEEVLRHGFFAVGNDVAGMGGLPPLVASVDTEIDGMPVKKGECVLIDAAATNHDPEVFENSERFDVTRKPNPHLTLNHGMHHCLGAPLARMEMQVAIGSLFRRFPTLALAGEPQYATEYLTAGMSELPVTW